MIDAAQRQFDLPENLAKKVAPIAAMINGFDTNGDGTFGEAERAPVRTLIQLSGSPGRCSTTRHSPAGISRAGHTD